MIHATKGKSINCCILRKGELKSLVHSFPGQRLTWLDQRKSLHFIFGATCIFITYETRWSDASRGITQPTTLTLKRRRQTSAVIFMLGLLFAAYFVDVSAQLWSPRWINDARRDSASAHLRRNGKWYSGNWGAAAAFRSAADSLSQRRRDGCGGREANVWRQLRKAKFLARAVDVIRNERPKTNERKCECLTKGQSGTRK